MKKSLILSIVLFLSINIASAQKGFLRGSIFDSETGEPLIGATISQEGTTHGTVADFDGNYSLSLDEGANTIVFQFIGYQPKVVENIIIKEGDVTSLNISLSSDVEQLQEVVVKAEMIRDSEVAVMMLQKKSANLLDGISSQSFRKTGDSNLSGAIKRVTGVSVQSGKYVYVRGLGDRYTRTTLNGLTIPGMDPERNDVQIDMFPTSVLENVMVYKTFTPDLPGDFTGGIVNIETKSFPEEKTTSFSAGIEYNPTMHFRDDYVTYRGGDMDFLGFDNGSRDLPFDPATEIPQEYEDNPRLEELTRSLNPEMKARRSRNFMNTSFSFNHGNQIEKRAVKIGYSVVLNYQNQTEFFKDTRISSYYFKDQNKDIEALDLQSDARGDLGRNNVLWSTLFSGAVKTDNHQVGINLLRTQNGISETSDRIKADVEETGQTVHEDILTYTQRSLTNAIISGNHRFNDLIVEWGNSFSLSKVNDPDFRTVGMVELPAGEGTYEYSTRSGQGGNAARFWRSLDETNENFKIDFTYSLTETNKLKTGGFGLWKSRDFSTNSYLLETTLNRLNSNDPNLLLSHDNIWTAETASGTYLQGNYEAANNYNANSILFAGYIMNDVLIANKLRAIYGVRVEKNDMYYTGQNHQGTIKYDNEKTLNELNLLPSLNLVYKLTDDFNIRASYGRTLARPSFKEKSIAQILDPISGILFNGNIDLEQTMIDNFDLRVEKFFGNGEMISLSGFYKNFDGHIELTRYEVRFREVTPRNIGGSKVYGAELEFKKSIDFILDGLSVGSNISITKSSVDLNEVYVDANGEKSEYESRAEQARTNEEVSDVRPMAGQAPYLINAYLNFTDSQRILNINVSYNVQGESLSVVGVGQVPDVYTRPFNSLNLNASRKFGSKKQYQINAGIDNILGSNKEEVYKSFDDQEALFSQFKPGRSYSIKLIYNF